MQVRHLITSGQLQRAHALPLTPGDLEIHDKMGEFESGSSCRQKVGPEDGASREFRPRSLGCHRHCRRRRHEPISALKIAFVAAQLLQLLTGRVQSQVASLIDRQQLAGRLGLDSGQFARARHVEPLERPGGGRVPSVIGGPVIRNQRSPSGPDAPKLIPLSALDRYQEGSDLRLFCSASAPPSAGRLVFEWRRNQNELLAGEGREGAAGAARQRLQVTSMEEEGASLLRIAKLEADDSGNYTCLVRNQHGFDSSTVRVQVNVKLKWTLEPPAELQVKAGKFVQLECDASGQPTPLISWTRLRDHQMINSKVLRIDRVTVNNSGLYECRAVSGGPQQSSPNQAEQLRKLVRLTVNVPARFAEKFTVVQAKSGESAKLECNATGDQPLTVNWFKEDNKLSKRGGDNFEIYESMTNTGVNSVLVIRTVSRADGLTYKCIGENEYGNDERLIKLLVIEVPSRPMNVRVKEAWSRSAQLVWSSPFTGNSPITSYIIQYWRKNNNEAGQSGQNHRRQEFTVSGTQTSALVPSLSPSLTYEASVIAENQVGRSEPSENIVINTGEDEPIAAPSDVTVEARGPSTIRVAWKAPPSETWNGKLLGFYVGFRPRGAVNTIDVNQLGGSTSGTFSYRTIDYVKGQQLFETFLTNLMKGHEYELVVKAFNGIGSGPESHLMAVRTFDGDLPASPSLFAHQVSHSTISLRWTYPSRAQTSTNPIKRYVLYYQRQGDDSWLEIGIPVEEKLRSSNHHSNDVSSSQSSYSVSESGTTNYQLSGLDSGYAYKIYVVAVNNFGIGDPSNIVTTKTEQIGGINDSLRATGSHLGEMNVFEMNKQFQLFLVVPIVCTITMVVVVVVAVLYCTRRVQSPAAQHVVTSQGQQPQSTGTWGPEGPIQVGQRYVEFDKGGILKNNGSILGTQSSDHTSSGHPGNQGHYPLPYGTMPMNSVVISDQKSWDRQSSAPLKPLVTHIYDSPI